MAMSKQVVCNQCGHIIERGHKGLFRLSTRSLYLTYNCPVCKKKNYFEVDVLTWTVLTKMHKIEQED